MRIPYSFLVSRVVGILISYDEWKTHMDLFLFTYIFCIQSYVHLFSGLQHSSERFPGRGEDKPLSLLKVLRPFLQGLKRSQNNGYFAHKKPQSPHHNLSWSNRKGYGTFSDVTSDG